MNTYSHRRSWIVLAALACLSGASCGHAAGPSNQAPVAKPAAQPKRVPVALPKPPPSASIGDAMADHFMIATWARDVVTAGSIEPLREPLTALADYRYDDVRPGGWLPWIAQLQLAARVTASAQDLDAAAMGVATMTRICGECHRASGAGPELDPQLLRLPAAEREDVTGRMIRHIWAATLLWQGLSTPSDAAWEEGVRELHAAPDQLDEALPAEFDADLREVRARAVAASEANTLEERADAYGLLLATCAGCHERWMDDGMEFEE